MRLYGIEVPVKNVPALDSGFVPIGAFNAAFLKTANKPVGIAVERADGQMARVDTFIHGTPEMVEADRYYVNRLVKTILWMKGGFRVCVSGDRGMYDYLKAAYADGGEQDFDFHFMADVFECPFEVVYTDALPEAKDAPQAIGGHLDGCRIGFDAGGSDRKVSAVIDGESVYDEEVVWFPKTTADPQYHYDGIVAALKSAAEHLPRVDAVGVSSAGIYINNRTMRASLFLQVPPDLYDAKVKDIYIRAITDTFGDIPSIVKAWREYKPVRHLQKEEMTDHREVAKDVFLTAYEEGSYTVCNFSKEPFTYEGARIEPLGYALFNPDGTKKTFAFDKDKGLCEK